MRLFTIQFHRRRAGFSLVEIVLALSIVSFVLVAILGLFPVAIHAASDSRHETNAALIARSIFEQLEAHPETPIRALNLAEPLDKESPAPIRIDLSQPCDAVSMGFDAGGKPLGSASDSDAVYRAEVEVSPVPFPARGLSEVVVTVKSENEIFPFASLLRHP